MDGYNEGRPPYHCRIRLPAFRSYRPVNAAVLIDLPPGFSLYLSIFVADAPWSRSRESRVLISRIGPRLKRESEALLSPGAGLLSVRDDRSLSEIASGTSRSRDVLKLDSDGCS